MTDDHATPHQPDDPTGQGVPDDGMLEARRQMALVELVREVEKHVASDGWDQNPRLFALARTAELVALEPTLADALGDAATDPEALTPIEQEVPVQERPVDDLLATTMWPDEVAGAALVLERLMLPPSAEADLPDDAVALQAAVQEHPERQDVRMAVLVTRAGGRMCAVRMRQHDDDTEVLLGPDLVPRLVDALAATFS